MLGEDFAGDSRKRQLRASGEVKTDKVGEASWEGVQKEPRVSLVAAGSREWPVAAEPGFAGDFARETQPATSVGRASTVGRSHSQAQVASPDPSATAR